jgi:DNA ligase-1
MINFYNVLTKLDNADGSNEKKEILKAHPEIKIFLKYALDQDKYYHLTELPPFEAHDTVQTLTYLDYLSSKGSCTNAEAHTLANAVGPDLRAREVVNRILKKDLKCGVGAKLVNQVWKDLIFRVPYQRFSSFKDVDKIKFEGNTVLVQVKYDGMFSYLMDDGSFLTRNGSRFRVPGFVGLEKIFMGELLVVDVDGRYMPRAIGNGILNSIIQGGPVTHDVVYVTWGFVTKEDFLAGKSDTSYTNIFNWLTVNELPSNMILSESKQVESLDEALDYYMEAKKPGEEGAMIKVANLLKWKDESSGTKFGCKCKPHSDIEMHIVKAFYGDAGDKYEKVMGRLLVRSQCGLVVGYVGGGFTDADRNLGVDWWNSHAGDIVTVRITGLSLAKGSETYGMTHARFIETRFNDKDEANTYEEIKWLVGVS